MVSGPDDPWASVQIKRPVGWEGVQVKRARPAAPPNATNSVTGAQPMRGTPSFLGDHPPANADEALTEGLSRTGTTLPPQAPRRPGVVERTVASALRTSPLAPLGAASLAVPLARDIATDPLDIPRQVGAGLSESGHRTLGGAGALVEAATNAPATPIFSPTGNLLEMPSPTPPAPFTDLTDAVRASRDEGREFYGAPTTGSGMVANIGSQMAGDMAQVVAGGRLLQAAAPILAPTEGAGLVERFGKGMAANTLASLPVDVGQGVDPDVSLTTLAAEHTDSPLLDQMAGSTGGRILGDVAASALLGVVPEAVQATRGAGAVRRATQRVAQATREAQAASVAEALARRRGFVEESEQALRDRAGATTGLPLVEPSAPVARVRGPEPARVPPELEGLPLVGEGPTGVPLINDRPLNLGETPRPRPAPEPLPEVQTLDEVQRALRKRQRGAQATTAPEPTPVAPVAPEAPVAPQTTQRALEELRRRRLRGMEPVPPETADEVAELRSRAARSELDRRNTQRKLNTDPRTGLGSEHALQAARARVDADPAQSWVTADLGNVKAGNTHGPDLSVYPDARPASQSSWDRTTEVFRQKAAAVAQAAEEAGIPRRNIFTPSGDEIRVAIPAGVDRQAVLERIQRRSVELAPDTQAGGYPMSLRWGHGETLAEADAAVEAAKKASTQAHARELPRLDTPPETVTPPPRAPEPTAAPPKPTSTLSGIWANRSLQRIDEELRKVGREFGHAQARGDMTAIETIQRKQRALEEARTIRQARGPVVQRVPPEPGTVTTTTKRGRTVQEGGDPAYRTVSNEDLAAKRRRLMERAVENASDPRGNTRQNRGAGGRARGRATNDFAAVERIDAELRGRGLEVENHPPFDTFDSEGRTIGTGERPEVGGETRFGPELDETGTASHRVLAPLAGGGAGAVIGAATAEPDRRGEGAFKGFVGGVLAGHLAATVFTRRAPKPTAAPVDVSGMYVGKRAGLLREAPKGLLSSAQRAYQDLLDHVFAAREFGRRVGGAETLSYELERGMSWHGLADTYMGRQGQEGPTLARALRLAEGRAEDVTHLLQGERALELHDRAAGSALHLGLPEGISAKGFDIDATRRAVERLRAIPEVRKAADAYRDFYRELLDQRLAHRLISPEQYQRLVAAGEYYTPFLRDYGSAEFAGSMRTRQSEVQRGTGLRDLDVDEIANAPLRDPYALAVFDAQKTARDIARQRVTNVVTDIIDANPETARPFIERISDARLQEMTPGQRMRANIQEFNVDGTPQFYALHDRDLLRALERTAPLTESVGAKILKAAKTIKRVGVTIVPEFALTNAQKDLVFTANQYPASVKRALGTGLATGAAAALLGDEDKRGMNALKGFGFGVGAGALAPHVVRTLAALGDVLGESQVLQQWLRDGGGNTGFYLKTEEDAARLLRRLRGDNYTIGEVLNPKTWWQAVEHLQSAVEQAPRLARYKHLRGQGATAAAAVAGGHNVSVNFLRHGGDPMVQGLGKVTAFWNANLQGKAKLWRDLGISRSATGQFRLRNPRAWGLGAMAITAPTVALWIQNQDDPDYWNIPLWERNLFWHIPTGKDAGGHTKFVKLAKPFELGYLFASLPERFLDYLHQRDPQRLARGLRDMASGTFVEGIVPIPDIAQPTLDVTTTDRGYSRFTGRPVESQAMGRLPPGERSDERTSYPAKALGERFGVSPTKIDYWWRQTTGTLGRDVADAATSAARKVGLDDRAPTEPRSPLDRFRTRPPGFSADPVEELYLRNERAQQAKTAIRTAGTDEEARRLFEEYGPDLENMEAMEKAVAELAKARKELRAAQANRTLPVEERRRQVQQIQDYVVDVARSVVNEPQGAPR